MAEQPTGDKPRTSRLRARRRAEARAHRSDERMAEIVDAAARIFAEKGYLGTTVGDIAEAVGLVPASLYYYMQSKEDLLFEIISEAHGTGYEERADAAGGDVVAKLRTSIHYHVRFNAENALKSWTFYHEFRHLSEDRKAVILDQRNRYERFLVELVTQGQAEGALSCALPAELVVKTLLSAVNGLHQWYRPQGEVSPNQLADAYTELLLEGVTIRPTTSKRGGRPKSNGAAPAAARRRTS